MKNNSTKWVISLFIWLVNNKKYIVSATFIILAIFFLIHLYHSNQEEKYLEQQNENLEKDNKKIKEQIKLLEDDKKELYHSVDTSNSIKSLSSILSNLDTNKSR